MRAYINFEDWTISLVSGAKRYSESIANFQTDTGHMIERPERTPEGFDVVSVRYQGGMLTASNGSTQFELRNSALADRMQWALDAIDSLRTLQGARRG